MELVEIAKNMYLVPGPNGGSFPFSHAVWIDGERSLLFDAGPGPRAIAEFAAKHPVDAFVASHSHPGHISGLHVLEDCPIFAPELGVEEFGNLERLGLRFVSDSAARRLWTSVQRKVVGFRDVVHTHTYNGQSSFDMGDIKLDAIFTPGHTCDHHCFFEEHTGVLLAFDMDLSPAGPFYVCPESSLDDYRASLHLLRSYEPSVFVSGHLGVLREGISDAINQFLAVIDRRNNVVIELLGDAPVPVEALAKRHLFIPRFHQKLEPLYREWEARMLTLHLSELASDGRITAGQDGFRIPG